MKSAREHCEIRRNVNFERRFLRIPGRFLGNSLCDSFGRIFQQQKRELTKTFSYTGRENISEGGKHRVQESGKEGER